MAKAEVMEAYQRLQKEFSPEDLHALAELLEGVPVEPHERKRHSITELRGLGRDIWQGIDPQVYINELRAEWDHRP